MLFRSTACQAFGDLVRAQDLFEKARKIYESREETDPELMGGLYNNMALNCTALGRYDEAGELYGKAMRIMAGVKGGRLEMAITCLNQADLLEAKEGMEAAETRIFDLLDRALELLEDPDAPKDGYYAFVCEKCAPSFSYYGYFAAAQELEQAAEEIYRKNGW